MAQTDELDTAIEALERAVQSRRIELASMEQSLDRLRGNSPTYVSAPKTDEWASKGLVWAAAEWLKETGGGKTTREVADGVKDRGVRTTSRNFLNTVYATMANTKSKFVRKDGLWYLVGAKKPK